MAKVRKTSKAKAKKSAKKRSPGKTTDASAASGKRVASSAKKMKAAVAKEKSPRRKASKKRDGALQNRDGVESPPASESSGKSRTARKIGTGKSRTAGVDLGSLCRELEQLAPLGLAQSWDNVGLLVGDQETTVRTALLCIDLSSDVVQEAVELKAELIVAYHPPLFKPVSRLVAQSDDMTSLVLRCANHGISLYSTHTALDAADGGTNDVLAGFCGIEKAEPLEWMDDAVKSWCKVVVFVPREMTDDVAEAMFAAGGGKIAEYDKCSFRIPGTGTFHGSETTNPTVGEAGQYEMVPETRLEMVVSESRLGSVVSAMRATHPYEEPAYDVYPLRSGPMRGIGRVGALPKEIALGKLARSLKKSVGAGSVQIVGDADQPVARAVIVAGAAGSLPFRAGLSAGDVLITGEIRHHDALAIQRRGSSAIALGHWSSERPVLASFAERLGAMVPTLEVAVSEADGEVFSTV